MIDDHPLVPPPVVPLVVGALTALASVVLLLRTDEIAHTVGWAAGSLVTILAVALFRRGNIRASSSSYFSPRPRRERFAALVLVVGFVAAGAHAYFLATGRAA